MSVAPAPTRAPGPTIDATTRARVPTHRLSMNHGVVDLRLGLHDGSRTHSHPPAEVGSKVDVRGLGDPGRRVGHAVHLAFEQVEVRLEILRGRAEIEPIRIREVAGDVVPFRDDRWEHVPFDRDLLAGRPAAKHRWVQEIRPGVDVAGDRLLGFLSELAHAAVGLGQHQPERACVLHVMEGDGDRRTVLLGELAHRGEIEVGEDVAVQREERLVVPSASSALTIAPPVPSGSVSVIHVMAGSPRRESMNGSNISSR